MQAANARLQDLTELNLQLASEREPHGFSRSVCYGARKLLGATYALLAVYEKSESKELFVASSGIEDEELACRRRLCRTRMRVRSGVWLKRVPRGGRAASFSESGSVLPPGYPSAAPIWRRPSAPSISSYGWLCLIGKVGADEFTEDDDRVLSILSAQVGRIYENGSLLQ